MRFIERLFPLPTQSYFLLGPRGTGKSTLIRNAYPDALWIDLLRPDVYRNFLARPERLYELLAASASKTVIIDEVQKLPALLTVVHEVIEQKKGYCFILTGSSARKLKRSGADLLGGRALKRGLYPFLAAELGERFSLPTALTDGLLPLIYESDNAQDSLQAYINLYLQEEIQAEGLVRSLEQFSRFLEAISFSHASLLNTANIARECEVKRKTVENYLTLLEDLLLAYQLPVFTKRAQRELVAHPKFYLFDAGVFYALRPKGILDRPEEIQGAALEGLVAQHLKAWIDYSAANYQLAFWRTRAGVEVDFIVYGEQGFWALEVKNSSRVFAQDTKALETFIQDYPEARGILLYRGQERLKMGNIICLPCEDFLRQLQPGQSIIQNVRIL